MGEYDDKMKAHRQSLPQGGTMETRSVSDQTKHGAPAAKYQITSVDPKGGDIDEQFALIETTKPYGAPASDPSQRRIVVGDSLPEGEVTAITAEGIRVIPDEGDEYVIPLGGRPGYKPPVRQKTSPSPMNAAFKHYEDLVQSIYNFDKFRGIDTSRSDAEFEANLLMNVGPVGRASTAVLSPDGFGDDYEPYRDDYGEGLEPFELKAKPMPYMQRRDIDEETIQDKRDRDDPEQARRDATSNAFSQMIRQAEVDRRNR